MRRHAIIAALCSVLLLCGVNHGQAAGNMGQNEASSTGIEQGVERKVDLNNADVNELQTLPGIGPKTAERIDAYRKENGPFESVEDLLKVKGIGPKVLEKMKSLITVS